MQLFANNADSSLNGAIASDTVVLVLKTGEGDKFPSPANGDFFLVTLFQRVGTTELNHEIVKCTSRAGDNLTVVRAQEGTSAKPFNSGDLVELRFTKGSADNMVQKVAGKDLSTEDYTTAEKSKLAGVEAGAQVNTVASVAGKTGAVSLAKADVGLGNVDNTSDVNKPVSTATQNALNGKEGTITPGTAAQYFRGDKSWRDFFTDVRAATLTGLSTATNAVVVASDTVLSAIGKLQAQVSSKFDKAGGDISGNAYFKAGVQEAVVVANVGTAYTINLALGTIFDLTLTANCAYTFPAPTAGKQFTLLQRQDGAGSRTSTWPANVRWDDGGTAPTPTATVWCTDAFTFLADGSFWIGFKGPKNYNRS